MTASHVHQIKELLNLDSFEGYAGLVDPIRQLVKQRDVSQLQLESLVDDCKAQSRRYARYSNDRPDIDAMTLDQIPRLVGSSFSCRNDSMDLAKLSTDLRTQRDALYERLTQVVDVTGEPTLEELVECLVMQSEDRSKQLDELHDVATLLTNNGSMDTNVLTSVHRLLAAAPVVHDKRYIVHGDIQPCVVLYSDETTTLVRLDENDMMCETSTIEWSDELTYRCQEMLRGEAKRLGGHVSFSSIKLVAQLVRDERILLNDGGSVDA